MTSSCSTSTPAAAIASAAAYRVIELSRLQARADEALQALEAFYEAQPASSSQPVSWYEERRRLDRAETRAYAALTAYRDGAQ